MVSKFQWKPFWLATQRDPQNDWSATQNRVNYDVFAQAPSPLKAELGLEIGQHLPERTGRQGSHRHVFKHSSCSALDCLRKGSIGDTNGPLLFSFLEQNHAADNYTWQ